ncbi:MAG: hypothetical protein AABY15_03190 [Nanoarchaeota archaeon]
MKQVIGFKMFFGKDFLSKFEITYEDLITSSVSLHSGTVVAENKLSPDKGEKELMLEMIHKNPIRITDFDEETAMATIMFSSPIPADIYQQTCGDPEENLIFGE